MKQVCSFTGIGKRATTILIVTTQGFKHTENDLHLISYAGLNPKKYSGGSNIRGGVRICNHGSFHLRHILCMCALNTQAANGACKELSILLAAKVKTKNWS